MTSKKKDKKFAWSDFGKRFESESRHGAGETLTAYTIEEYFSSKYFNTRDRTNVNLLGLIRGHQQLSLFYYKKEMQGAGVYINSQTEQWMPENKKPLYLKNLKKPFVITLDFFRYDPYDSSSSWPQGKARILNLELDPDIKKCKFTRDVLKERPDVALLETQEELTTWEKYVGEINDAMKSSGIARQMAMNRAYEYFKRLTPEEKLKFQEIFICDIENLGKESKVRFENFYTLASNARTKEKAIKYWRKLEGPYNAAWWAYLQLGSHVRRYPGWGRI